ncbi:hypothetical protein ACLQ2N_24140 [Streptomyces sp. DT224]|uniref:hypothetical protein n=1 Tax=Streptomyces sp. DT224 TaxID=3393426 RepID=UPI003CEAC66E
MSRIRSTVVTSLAGALLAVTGLAASPASATVSEGYIAGTGTIRNDWNDEGKLSLTNHARSKAVGLWQWVLWAEHAMIYGNMGSAREFKLSDIDCVFGENTKWATEYVQMDGGMSSLETDGVVGPATFDYFASHLRDGGSYNDRYQLINYMGDGRTVRFLRSKTSGAYMFQAINGYNGLWTTASYTGTGC